MSEYYQPYPLSLPEPVRLRDDLFAQVPGACYVRGYNGQRYMDQFDGVGPSPVEYEMKAILRDGVFYIPAPTYGDPGLGPNGWRTIGATFVKADIQDIPSNKIRMLK